MKKSQKKIVIDWLNTNGEVTRNQCLQNYISRLGAIIQVLENEGWVFKTSRRGNDYVYTLSTSPIPKKPTLKIVMKEGQAVAVVT